MELSVETRYNSIHFSLLNVVLMKAFLTSTLFLLSALHGYSWAQAPLPSKGDTTEILKAEDARRYDAVIENFLVGKHEEKYVIRALLAAGRIGDERAVPRVASLLNDGSPKVRDMAAFALGEIESLKAADII